MTVKRINITLPEELLKSLDKKVNDGERSAVIAEALELYLRKKSMEDIVQEMIEGYKESYIDDLETNKEWTWLQAQEKNMNPKRGEIVLISLDPTIGSEIKKTRPAMIISNNVANEFSSLVTVLPITSQKATRVYPFEVLIDSKDASLTKKSKIKCDQIRAVDKSRIVKKIGQLPIKAVKDVEKALILHLSISLDHFFI